MNNAMLPDLKKPELPPEVKVLRPSWLQMMMEVVFVDLHVGRWRAKTALAFNDLGLSGNQQQTVLKQFSEMIELGDKILLPPVPQESEFFDSKKPKRTYAQVLNSIEQTARYFVDSRTSSLKWGHALQLQRLDEFEESIKEYGDKYMTVRDELVGTEARWSKHVRNLELAYYDFAVESAKRQTLLDPSRPIGETEFFQALWDQIKKLIPTRTTFYDSFYFTIDYEFIDLGPWIDTEAQMRAWESIRRDPRTQAEARAYEVIFEKRKAVLERQNSEMEELRDQFLKDVKVRFANLVYGACVDILESMQRSNGDMVGRSAGRLATLMQVLEKESFPVDDDARAMSERVRELILMEDLRTAEDIRSALKDIAIVNRATLLALEEEPRSGREVGIPDVLAFEEIQRARASLDCVIPELEETTRGSRQA